MSGRISRFRAEKATLIKHMQTFCLRPNKELFDKICAEKSVTADETWDYWRMAAEYKYGFSTTTDDFPAECAWICERVKEKPSQSVARCCMQMFYATGELKFTDLYYQLIGDERLPMPTRMQLAQEFKRVKMLYLEEIDYLLTVDKEFYSKLGLLMSTIDFSYFDDADERARADKTAAADLRTMLGKN